MGIFTLAAQAISSVFVLPVPKPKPPKHSDYFRMYTCPMSEYAIRIFTNGREYKFRDSDELSEWIKTL